MRTKLKQLLAKLGHFLVARFDVSTKELAAVVEPIVEKVEALYLDSAKAITAQTARLEVSSEMKRHEALRALLNIHPLAKEKDLCYAIEVALR